MTLVKFLSDLWVILAAMGYISEVKGDPSCIIHVIVHNSYIADQIKANIRTMSQ